MRIYKYFIDYILPNRCMSCASLTQDEGGFCAICWKEIEFIGSPICISCGRNFTLNTTEGYTCLGCIASPPNYDMARALFKFGAVSKNIIHAFKYYDKTILAKHFADMLCAKYSQEIYDADVVIPVPMHKIKRLIRMYNQAAVLASAVGAKIKKPIYFDVLQKTKWTKPQTLLSRKTRMTNVNGSIDIRNIHYIKDKNIILIDDVMTTGSTASLCSRLLKRAGAKKVVVLCIAST